MMNWNMRTCKTDDCLITAQLHIWPESTRTRVHVKLRPHVLSEAASWWGLDAATWSRTSWYGRSTGRAVNAVNMESSSFYKFAAELRVWQNCAHTHTHTHILTHTLYLSHHHYFYKGINSRFSSSFHKWSRGADFLLIYLFKSTLCLFNLIQAR